MKLFETHFEEYINAVKQFNLHIELIKIYKLFPEDLKNMKNIIFYGPSGVGKYSQMLCAIQKFSPTQLKYEKKMSINFQNKSEYFLKISDIHYEVDMSLLGCHAKTLWNDIYNQILDSITTKSDQRGIIVCKYFHEIHSELLEIFYNYINNNKNIIFILLSENCSFIPYNIINSCKIISICHPSKLRLKQCFKTNKIIDSNNLKNIKLKIKTYEHNYIKLCNNIIHRLVHIEELDFLELRELLYNIFIYQYNIYECVEYIIKTLIQKNYLTNDNIDKVFIKLHNFFILYNNNYRPIYHLENIMLYLCRVIHGF